MSIKLIRRLSSSVILAIAVLFVLTVAVSHATTTPVQVTSNGSVLATMFTSTATLPQVIKTIQLPLGVVRDIRVIKGNPLTGYIYASGSEGLSIISGSQVLKNLPIAATALEINPTSGYVYAAAGSSVLVLSDTQVITSFNFNGDSSQVSLRSSLHSGYVYVAEGAYGLLTVLSGTQRLTSYDIGLYPIGLTIDPATDYLYVADAISGNLTILLGTQVITAYNIGPYPNAIGVNPATGYVYIPTWSHGTFVLSNTAPITNLPINAQAVAASPQSGLVYLGVGGDIVVVSGTEVITSIQTQTGWWNSVSYIKFNSTTGHVYVLPSYPNQIYVLSDTTVIAQLPGPCQRGCYAGLPFEVDGRTGYAYGFDQIDNKITVISGAAVSAILTSPNPAAIGIDPLTDHAYVADGSGMIELAGDMPVASLAAGFKPEHVRTAPPSQFAYVGSSSLAGGVIPLFDKQALSQTTLDRFTSQIDFDSGSAPSLAYVPNYDSRTVSVVYGPEIVATIPVPYPPILARFNPSTHYGYVVLDMGTMYWASYQLAVLYEGELVTTITLPSNWLNYGTFYPSGIAINPKTDLTYVTLESQDLSYPGIGGPGSVFVISGPQVVASPTLGLQAKSPVVNPRTGYVYVLNQLSNNVSVLSGTKVIATVPTEAPMAAAVNPTTGYVYVVDQYKTKITVFSGTDIITRLEPGFPASTTDLPGSGYNPPQNATLDVNPASGYVYVLHDCCQAVTVLSGTHIAGILPLNGRPRTVSANPDTGLIYVANDLEQNIAVIQDLIVPRAQTLSSLFTPNDDLLVCFSGAVLTSTVNFQLEPALPLQVNWSPDAKCATISHAVFQISRPYTLSVKPGGQSPNSLVVVAKDFTFRYHPYHWLLPRLDRFVY